MGLKAYITCEELEVLAKSHFVFTIYVQILGTVTILFQTVLSQRKGKHVK